MSSKTYVLKDGQPIEADHYEWGLWMEQNRHERQIALTEIGEARVSTVFLGLDHGYGDGPPILWETMIFEGPLDGEQERYHTREEALSGHERMVALVEAAQQQAQAAQPEAQ